MVEKRKFKLAAKIVYIDFEGRADSKSIKELLEKIRPRQLVSEILLTGIVCSCDVFLCLAT